MKKENALLAVVIAFIIGVVTGASVAILTRPKSGEGAAMVQSSQLGPQADLPPNSSELSPLEAAAKIQPLKDILKKDPKNLSAWVELGNLYFDSNQPNEAIEAYSHYLAIKPDNPDVRTDMGIMYRKIGNFDRAIEEFKRAAKDDPKHAGSRYNMGIVLLHDKGDVKGAVKAWEDYLRVDPNSDRAMRVKAQMDKLKQMPQGMLKP